MKTIKRISALLLALLLVASFSITAFAAEGDDSSNDNSGSESGNTVTGGNTVVNDPPADAPATKAPATDGAKGGDNGTSSGTITQKVNVSGTGSGVEVKLGDNVIDVDKEPQITVTPASGQSPETVTIDANLYNSDGWSDGLSTNGKGDFAVVVNGDITTTGTSSSGVNAELKTGSVDVTVNGDITTTGKFAIGIIAAPDGGNVSVTALGDVDASDHGVYSPNYGGTAEVTVGSEEKPCNVEASNDGIHIEFGDLTGGNAVTNVTVYGDVTGTNSGITVSNSASSSGGGTATVTVGGEDKDGNYIGGTVSGGIVLGDNVTATNTQITLWKTDSISFVNEPTNSDDIIKAVMNYYVRKDDANGKVSFGDISATTANYGQNVSFTVTSSSGKTIDKVFFTNNDQDVADVDSNGTYSFSAPKLGGIMLRVTFKTDPSPTPDPKPQASSPMFAATYKLKFDFDGGVLDGETELEMKCSAGQRIKLPEAPTKEGFTFAGWQTEVRGQKIVFEAGEKYTVTAAKTFVALWEEN